MNIYREISNREAISLRRHVYHNVTQGYKIINRQKGQENVFKHYEVWKVGIGSFSPDMSGIYHFYSDLIIIKIERVRKILLVFTATQGTNDFSVSLAFDRIYEFDLSSGVNVSW